ncbi:protein kinase-like domain, concanavalin A-like lectin/glucanase domain protein [Tanacetum coccineum]
MQELREDTFAGNKKGDAHEHVDRILDIASLFNILGVTHDSVMLRVFPITLTGAAKRWVDRLTPSTVNTWDLLKKAFIQRYCPPSKTAKQLEEFRNFKQEGDETLYQAWERGQFLNISSSSNSDRIAIIVSKLDNLGRDMKKLKENVHAIQVGCQLYGGPNLVKECPLNVETKIVEEVNSQSNDQPLSGKRKLNLTETINKYMEEMAKRHAEQDEWLKKLYMHTEISSENHDEVIQSLETKVKTLTNEVEGRTNKAKFEECKATYMEDGTPLYTHFCYSPEEIEYFFANSRISDNEKQENETLEISKGVTRVDITPNIKQAPQVEKQNVSYFVEPYEPPIPFPIHLEQHAEEALNQLPPKEQDPGSFILPCSIGMLDFNNALADLGDSISIMPFSMYKRFGMGKLEPINMVIEMQDNKKDYRMPIILGRPLLATTPMLSKIYMGDDDLIDSESYEFDQLLGIDLDIFAYDIDMQGSYKEPKTDQEKVCKMMKDRILKDYWREIFNEGEEKDDHKEFKTNAVLEIILDKMNETWFSSTSNDKDDLEGMIDYLEPNLYNGFTGPGNERKCKLLGIIYREAPTILIERVKVTRYNIGPSETYTKTKILGIYEIPRTSANVATVHAVIMDEVNTEGGAQRAK